LRRTVQQWTGIPVSVGIAPTKTLAKVANRFAKKDPDRGGVCLLLNEAAQRGALGRLELMDSGRLGQRLKAVGIATPLALRDTDPRFVRGIAASCSSAWSMSCAACRASASNR